jgi:hypothetical protein
MNILRMGEWWRGRCSEKHVRHTVASMLAQHPHGKRWPAILSLLGLCLGCGTWLYLAVQSPLLLGLALTVACGASLGGALWLMFSWKPRVGILAMVIFLAAGVGFFWWQASTHVLDFPKWPIPHLPPGVVPDSPVAKRSQLQQLAQSVGRGGYQGDSSNHRVMPESGVE